MFLPNYFRATTHNIVTFFLSQRKNLRAFAPFQKENPTVAAFLTFPLAKDRPTFLKKIFSFSKGQADVLQKNILLY